MGYRNLRQCVEDLAANGHLVRCTDEIDAHLEAAEIQRRVFRADGPAVLFENVRNCSFPMVSNLFGSLSRAHFMFRDTLEWVQRLVELKTDSNAFWKKPLRYWKAPWMATRMRPRRCRRGPVLACQTTVDQLPQLHSWPDDGGAFITLPQVYTEHADEPGIQRSNLGMYRIQLSGGQYAANEEIGLHYQLHRGIGVHHAAAIRNQSPFHVNVFVGGSPAMNLAAVMPLPENLSELLFAGALGNRRTPMVVGASPLPIYAEADFCITGQVDPDRMLPEGPFGDHLGYYSLAHDFPVLKVEKVFHRRDAIWPFNRRRPSTPGGYEFRPAYSRNHRGSHSPVNCRTTRRARGRCHWCSPLATGHWQRTLRSLRLQFSASRVTDPGKRHPWPGPVIPGQVPLDR